MRLYTALLFSLISCIAKADTLAPTFPGDGQVVVLSLRNGATIADETKISEFLAFLGGIKGGWGYTWHTYPTPQESLFFVSKDGKNICRLDIGTNWIGSTCGVELKNRWPPFVTVSSAHAEYLRSFVNGTWEVK